MGDNFGGKNVGRAVGERDPGASLGGTDWGYVWFPAGLATNGALCADGSNGPTISVTGTTAQSQIVQHAFAIATAKDHDHLNCLVPNDYNPSGGLYLIIPWRCVDATGTKKACWEHSWKVLTPNASGVFDAAGTAGTMVKTTVAGTTLRVTNSVLTCPTSVSGAAKAGDILHVRFAHDYTQAENPGNTVDLVGGVILKYKRA